MSGFNIFNRQNALFLTSVAALWALAEGAPIWLVAALVLPPPLYAVLSHFRQKALSDLTEGRRVSQLPQYIS